MTLPVSVSSPTRILVVDDHPIVRQGLDRLVAAESDLQVVAEAATARRRGSASLSNRAALCNTTEREISLRMNRSTVLCWMA